jgi:hypothetical protein
MKDAGGVSVANEGDINGFHNRIIAQQQNPGQQVTHSRNPNSILFSGIEIACFDP